MCGLLYIASCKLRPAPSCPYTLACEAMCDSTTVNDVVGGCAASLTCWSAHSGVERQQLIWVTLLACVDGIALLPVVDADLGRLRVLDTSETYVVDDDCRSQHLVRAHSSRRLVTVSLNAM